MLPNATLCYIAFVSLGQCVGYFDKSLSLWGLILLAAYIHYHPLLLSAVSRRQRITKLGGQFVAARGPGKTTLTRLTFGYGFMLAHVLILEIVASESQVWAL